MGSGGQSVLASIVSSWLDSYGLLATPRIALRPSIWCPGSPSDRPVISRWQEAKISIGSFYAAGTPFFGANNALGVWGVG